jgi:hypothetical protein
LGVPTHNFTVGNADNKAAVLAEDALLLLVQLLHVGGSAEVRKTAAKALYNLVQGRGTVCAAGRRQVARLGYTRDQLKALSGI